MDFFIPLLTSGAGTALAIFISKVQIERHKKSLSEELEKLKGLLDVKNHVSRAQFDKEFEVYQKIWELHLPARIAAINLRPRLDYIDPNEDKQARKNKRLKSFYDHLTLLRDAVEANKPFMDTTVYQAVLSFMEEMRKEAIYYECMEPEDVKGEYYKEAIKNQEEIQSACEAASVAIRNRLTSVIVVP